MIRLLKVTPQRLILAFQELNQRNCRVQAIAKQLMLAVRSCDDYWETGTRPEQMQRFFVDKLTQCNDDIESLHVTIREYTAGLEETLHRWHRECELHDMNRYSLTHFIDID